MKISALSKGERTNMLGPPPLLLPLSCSFLFSFQWSPPHPSLPSSTNVLFEWSLKPWSRGLVRSHDKLKSYLHYHSVYGHQTWKDGKLPWWTPAYKVTWQIKTLYLHYQSAINTMSIVFSFGRVEIKKTRGSLP